MKLYWMTMNGNEWLRESHPDCDADTMMSLVADYYHRTKGSAERLSEGWVRNGETECEATLYPCGETDDGDWRGSYAIELAFDKVRDH